LTDQVERPGVAVVPGGHGHPARRPWVVVSVTASVDGRVALNRSTTLMDEVAADVWRLLHPAGAEQVLAERRALIESAFHPEVVLEGSGTFVTDRAEPPAGLPPANVRASTLLEHYLPEPADCRWFVVVDSRGRIRWTYTGDAGTRLLVLVSRSTPIDYLAYLRRQGIPYVVAGGDRVDLPLALSLLAELLGVTCVVSEAGGGLNGALLRAGLVDEFHLVLLPSLIGGRDTPGTFDGAPLLPGQIPTPLRLRDVQSTTDGVVRLHYEAAVPRE